MSRFFGNLLQVGYVVCDIEASMHHWAEALGVGPWYYIERLHVPDFTYRGRPSPVELSLALANSGSMQIELIQQRNHAPSLYEEFNYSQQQYDGGVQHLGYGTYDFERTLGNALAQGYEVGQQGTGGSRGPFAYLLTDGYTQCCDTHGMSGGHPGTVVEIIDLSHGRKELFEAIYLASLGWNGENPIRTQLPI